jgi:hypothetical protein
VPDAKNSKGGRKPKSDSQKRVAEELGVGQQTISDLRSVQAAQHRYQHEYRLKEIRQRLQAVCEQAGL